MLEAMRIAAGDLIPPETFNRLLTENPIQDIPIAPGEEDMYIASFRHALDELTQLPKEVLEGHIQELDLKIAERVRNN